MHLFQQGQQFSSYWRSLKSGLSAPIHNPCWNTVLNLSMLIKHSLIEVYLCRQSGLLELFCMCLGCDQNHKRDKFNNSRLPLEISALWPRNWCHFEFLCFSSPDVLATTRKQNTALDSAYGQWTSFHLTASADLAGYHWALTEIGLLRG